MIDKEAGNTLWRDSISKKMKNILVDFQVLNNDQDILLGNIFPECHMIFDVKMDFNRKALFVDNREKTPDPKESTYAGVVPR